MTLLLLFPATTQEVADGIIARVERLLHARLVEDGGERVDHFSTRTNPTRAIVLGFIDDFASIVYMRTRALDGLTCPDRADSIRIAAEVLIAQRVAVEIEQAYWPEEVVEAASVEARRDAWIADMDLLVTAVNECRSVEDDTGGDSGDRNDPAWRFPPMRPICF